MDGCGKDISIVIVCMFADDVYPPWSRRKNLRLGFMNLEKEFFFNFFHEKVAAF
jgi:hypothetical protein